MTVARVLGDGVLVLLDPLKMVSGGIHLVADNSENHVRTGTVLKVGPGRYKTDSHHRRSLGVEVGERICFLRWHLEHKTGKALAAAVSEVEGEIGLIKVEDILFAWSAHENIQVSQ